MEQPVPVAVFDANQPPALAMTRSLGRAGVPVDVYSHEGIGAATVSRYARKRGSCPDPARADVFLPWLEARIRAGEIRLVAPTSDLIAFYANELRHLFEDQIRRAMPPSENVLAALFKDRFGERLAAHGFATPRSAFPLGLDEAVEAARALRYPVVLKPRSHVAVGWARGLVVHDADELARSYAAYPIGPESRELVARYPELRWPMLQEYVPGALDNLFSVSGLLGPDGTLIAASASRKLLQWPPKLGVGVIFECEVDAGLVALGTDAARKLLGAGLFEIELIRDARTGEHLAIDLNPRAYGQITLDIARGVDLPRLWYESLFLGGMTEVAARADVRWHHFWPFHVSHLAGIATGTGRAGRVADYVRQARAPHVDIANDWGDPLPNVIFALNIWRHPGGLLRPFLQRGDG